MIDEKGRLFGKINILDLLVLLVAVAAVVVLMVQLVGGYIADREAASDPTPTPTATPTPTPAIGTSLIEFTVQCNCLDPAEFAEIKKHLENGDNKLFNGDGSQVEEGEIVALNSKPYEVSVTDDDGTIHVEKDPYFVNAMFTFRAVTTNAESHGFYGQEIRIGRSFALRTQFYEMVGLVVDVETLEVYPPEAEE